MRELATVGALCSLEGTNPQLMFHMNAAMNCDLSKEQMDQLVGVIGQELGEERGRNAEAVLLSGDGASKKHEWKTAGRRINET